MHRAKLTINSLWRFALSSVLLFVPLHLGSPAAFGQGSPNVVLILSDDQGWTDWQKDAILNPTGSVVYETPNLLRLAQQGVTLNRAYAAAPLCSPTRVSLLTGKSTARTKVTNIIPFVTPTYSTANLNEPPNWTKGLLQADITVAESFRSAGYSTGFFGKWHVGTQVNSFNPLDHGFDVNVGGSGAYGPDAAGGYFAGSDGGWPNLPGLAGPYPTDKYISDAIDEQATSYIGQHANGNTPFFMEMAEYPVHTPIEAPSDLVAKYQAKINALTLQGVDMKGHTNAAYAAMLEKLDQSVGRILDRLDDPNNDGNTADSVRNNTVVMFTADNGGVWAPGSQEGAITQNLPLRSGKGSLYEGGIREPYIVSWKGNANIAQGTISNVRTTSYDIYPTLLDMAGYLNNAAVPKNPNMDGVSIRSALEGQAFDRGNLYWHFPHVSNQAQSSSSVAGGKFVSAVANDQFKLIFFYDDRHYELYDLANDIGETTNLLYQKLDVTYSLSKSLNNYLASVGALMPVSKATGLAVALPPIMVPGDYDQNGIVAANDFEIWKSVFGTSVTPGTGADGSGDGLISVNDYTIWRDHLGLSASGSGSGSGSGGGLQLASSGVPEPSSAALVGAAVAVCLGCAKSRHRSRIPRRVLGLVGRRR